MTKATGRPPQGQAALSPKKSSFTRIFWSRFLASTEVPLTHRILYFQLWNFSRSGQQWVRVPYGEWASRFGLGEATVKRAFAGMEALPVPLVASKGHKQGRTVQYWPLLNPDTDDKNPIEERSK